MAAGLGERVSAGFISHLLAASLWLCVSTYLLDSLAIHLPRCPLKFADHLRVCHTSSSRSPTRRNWPCSWWADMLATCMPNRLPQLSFHTKVASFSRSPPRMPSSNPRDKERMREHTHTHAHTHTQTHTHAKCKNNEGARERERDERETERRKCLACWGCRLAV